MTDIQLLELAVEVGALSPDCRPPASCLPPSCWIRCSKYMRSKASRASRSGISSGMPMGHGRGRLFHRREHALTSRRRFRSKGRLRRACAPRVSCGRLPANRSCAAGSCRRGEPPHRADAGFDQLRQHEVGNVGHVLAMIAQGRHLDGQAGQTIEQTAFEFAGRDHGVEAATAGAHQPRAAAFDAVDSRPRPFCSRRPNSPTSGR